MYNIVYVKKITLKEGTNIVLTSFTASYSHILLKHRIYLIKKREMIYICLSLLNKYSFVNMLHKFVVMRSIFTTR